MKKIIFPLLMALSFHSIAQSKFAIGLCSSLDICSLSGVPGEYTGIAAFYNRPALGYQGGFRLRYDVNTLFSLQTGFAMISHQVSSGKEHLNPLDPQDPYVPQYYQQNATYKSFQIPVLCSFYFGDIWRFGFSIGPAYNYIYRDDMRATVYYSNKTEEETGTYRLTSHNQFLSALASVGVEYNIPRWAFRIEPTLNYQLFFFDNKYVNENYRLWSAGLSVSGFYRF